MIPAGHATRWSRAYKTLENLFVLRGTITVSDVEIGFGWIGVIAGCLGYLAWGWI